MIEAGSLIRSLSGRPAARNFHTFVINEIGLGIVTGRFPIGSILASDAVMMEEYGVSRTVLREALKTLEAKGMIEIACKKAINEKRHLRDIIAADPRISVHLDAATLEKLFDPSTYLGATDAMIERALTLYSLHFGQ